MEQTSPGADLAGPDAARPAKRRRSNEFVPPLMAPALNLVLFGTRGAQKTKAAKAILGHPVSRSSDCVKHQAEVCGHRLTLVQLPSLCGESHEAAMKDSIRCVSECHPEGVHAFIQVLPMGPLTDEDKGEFETIQKTFGSQVEDFTMFLFTSESDPSAQANVDLKRDKDIHELTQRCKGGCFVLNIRDEQQIPKLINHVVEKMQEDQEKPCSYTCETFLHAQMEKVNTLPGKDEDLKTSPVSCEGERQTPESLRIVLLGKTGCGKSSSGNTILGRKVFEAKAMQTSVTRHCQKKHGEVNSRQVTVVDTPGLFDSTLSHEEIHEEMLQCISLLAPGPHVFLLVLRIGRLTPEERETIKLIREGFGRGADKFTIILFTGGDTLEHEGTSIDEYIKERCEESFKDLIADCGGRYHLFNNYDGKDQTQVSELITKIDEMVKRNSCFTNDMLEEAEDAIQTNMRRLLKEKEEEMEREKKDLEEKHKEAIKEMKERNKKQIADINEKRKLGEKRLREMEENIKKEHNERKSDQRKRGREEKKRKQQEESHRRQMEQKLADLEHQIQTKLESKEAVDKELQETKERMKNEKEAWETRQKVLSEKRKKQDKLRQQKEQAKLRKLKEEYEREKEENERKRKEEDRIRREEEENERKAIEEKSKKEIENLKNTYEEAARQKAEELNEFKEKYKKDFEAMEQEYKKQIETKEKKFDILRALSAKKEEQLKKKHLDQICTFVKHVTKKNEDLKKIDDLQKKQEEEMTELTNEEEKRKLQEEHEKQMEDLIKKLLNQGDDYFFTWIRKSLWFE